MLQENNYKVPRTKFGGRRRSWYIPGVARSCQVGTGALLNFLLPDLRPGVNSEDLAGSGELHPNRGDSLGRRGGRVSEGPCGGHLSSPLPPLRASSVSESVGGGGEDPLPLPLPPSPRNWELPEWRVCAFVAEPRVTSPVPGTQEAPDD